MDSNSKNVDIFRDTPVRYLGYANELGEAFRAFVPVRWVRLSYALASAYVVADSVHKGSIAAKYPWTNDREKNKKVAQAVADTVVWQGFASVIIPGFTINRLCFFSARVLGKVLRTVPLISRRYLVTGLGLATIPFIVKPIDQSVDYMMNSSIRKLYQIGEVLQEGVVHHTRRE